MRTADTPIPNARDGRRAARVGIGVIVCFCIACIAVLGRVAQLQIAPPAALSELMTDHIAARRQLAPRGDLLDRRGRLLAGTKTGQRVFVDPVRFPARDGEAIVTLAQTIGIDPDDVGGRILPRVAENARRATEGESLIRYVSIGGILDASRADAVRALNIPGVHLELRSVRDMAGLDPTLTAIIGKVGFEHEGRLGAELAFDESLAPKHGAMRFLHDARGRPLWIDSGGYDPPAFGEGVRLSIDAHIQQIAEEEARAALEEMDAAGARVLVLEPSTGEILAMVDCIREPSDVVPLATPPDQPGRRNVIRPDPRRDSEPAMARNRSVEDAYEPGSTFKPFMWVAVTELGLAKPDEVIDTEGGRWRTPYNRLIEDVVELDSQTWREVLVNSSNIGMSKVTDRLTDRQMQDAIRKFGFGAPTDIGLPGEAAGLVTSPENWTKYTRTSVAFGYEIAVTPVQMIRAFSVFARPGRLAGTLPALRLTAAPPGDAAMAPVHRVLPAWTALLAREAMRDVVANMDDRLLQAGILQEEPKYTLFGKSGTAKIANTVHGGYFDRQYVSSFIAGAPADAPRIVVLAVMDDPGPDLIARRQHYGSWVAGPVVRRVVERVLPYLGVAPSHDAGDGEMVTTAIDN